MMCQARLEGMLLEEALPGWGWFEATANQGLLVLVALVQAVKKKAEEQD